MHFTLNNLFFVSWEHVFSTDIISSIMQWNMQAWFIVEFYFTYDRTN